LGRLPVAKLIAGVISRNPWLVAAVVVVPTFMEALDTTIAVVALRYIAGGLSATVDDGEWVLTSYLAANAIILPITGWLSAHPGRRNAALANEPTKINADPMGEGWFFKLKLEGLGASNP
jgi:glycine cleavage system H lipoate-binding protein